METRKLPPIYYFNSTEEAKEAVLKDGEIVRHLNFAIIFFFESRREAFIKHKNSKGIALPLQEIYVLKANFYFNGDMVHTTTFRLLENNFNILKDSAQLSKGKSTANPELKDKIYEFIKDNHFPCTHSSLTLSSDGKFITIDHHQSDIKIEGQINPIFQAEELGCTSQAQLLNLLYKMEADPLSPFYMRFYQKKKTEICGKSYSIAMPVREMIHRVHQAYGSTYMSIEDFAAEKARIASRWPKELLTDDKKEILDDFETYYDKNCHNPDYFPRHVLVEKWVNHYTHIHHGENPFTTLNEHRRTGCLSIFNPLVIPDSILLFYKFMAGEEIPKDLVKIINGQKSKSEFTNELEDAIKMRRMR